MKLQTMFALVLCHLTQSDSENPLMEKQWHNIVQVPKHLIEGLADKVFSSIGKNTRTQSSPIRGASEASGGDYDEPSVHWVYPPTEPSFPNPLTNQPFVPTSTLLGDPVRGEDECPRYFNTRTDADATQDLITTPF